MDRNITTICWRRQHTLDVTVMETQLSINTVCDYFGFCRNVLCQSYYIMSVALSEPGRIVKIYESNIETRKNNKGHLLKNKVKHIGIFGGL